MDFKMRILLKNLRPRVNYTLRRSSSTEPSYIYPTKEEEYSQLPLYPRLKQSDYDSEEVKELKKWHEKIKRQLTVEEKLFEVNVPRLCGWKCFTIKEGVVPYDNLVFAKHMTRTHLIETEKLPAYYDQFSEKTSTLLTQIKKDVIDAIEYQLDVRHHKISKICEGIEREKEMTRIIVTELNKVVSQNLWDSESHLKQVQVDYSPRIEASWKINSLVETFVRKEYKYGIPLDELPEEYLERPSDKYVQYLGQPILQLRHSAPLPQIIDPSEATIFSYSVPVYEYDAHVALGYELERRFMTNIPGFWPGDDREFSFLSYHFSNHVKGRPPSYGEDKQETLESQAIFASFGWLMPIACYQGFSVYHDVTYPLVTQTVLTDGKDFNFAVYQLNTTELHHKNPYENPKSNICWMTPTLSLYEAFEDGKLKGVNDEVIDRLVRFYINEPKTLNCNMKPYLGESIKHTADFKDDEKCEWLNKEFKKTCAQVVNLRVDKMYEVYDWERIFKIQFRMRPADARKRPFELRQNPYHKSMSDMKGLYIPKELRPDKDLPKYKQAKFRKTFYPQ